MKKFLQVGLKPRLEPASPVWTASCCSATYTKTQNYYHKSITGHKKLDNVKIGYI